MTMKMFSVALVFVLGCAGPSGTGTSSGGTWGWTTGGTGGGGAGGSGGTGGEASGGIDPDLWVCSCPNGMCFDQTEGCTVPG